MPSEIDLSMDAGRMPQTPVGVDCSACGSVLHAEGTNGTFGLRCGKCDAWYTLTQPEPSQVPASAKNPHRYVKPEAKPRKIAIVGKAPSSMGLAPYDDPEWEIWSINDSMYRKMIPRCTRQFELHNIELTKQPGYDDYYKWLCETNIPVYTNADYQDIPSRIIYPRYEIVEAFPVFVPVWKNEPKVLQLVQKGCTYYTNSISYLVTLAVYEMLGVPQEQRSQCVIGLWGVDMAQHGPAFGGKSEYAAQRPSVELSLGIAMGAGMSIVIPDECDLMKTKQMYGFDTYNEMMKKCTARMNELDGRINGCRKIVDEKQREADFLDGARQDMQWVAQWF